MPAAAIAFALYIFMGVHIHAPQQLPEVDWIKVVPYLVVLVTAVVGVNVMVVLVLGLVLSGVVGVFTGTYDLFGWFAAMGEGITGMGELIIITMMAGGLNGNHSLQRRYRLYPARTDPAYTFQTRGGIKHSGIGERYQLVYG